MSMLSLKNLSKKFGGITVANGISLDIPRGEAFGIVGPNGAGKSTLFNLITGNLRPDAGNIVFDGNDVTRSSAMDRCRAGIGRSFQIPQPFGSLSVFENLLVAATNGRDMSETQVADNCASILVQTEMIDKADVLAGQLSLLDRKRLELARAMATHPRLLLLDEIAGGLTDAECEALMDTIRSVNAQGTTIIWIEHVLHALTSVVSRIMVLDFGRVVGIGDPKEVMAMREVQEIYLGIEA